MTAGVQDEMLLRHPSPWMSTNSQLQAVWERKVYKKEGEMERSSATATVLNRTCHSIDITPATKPPSSETSVQPLS